MFRVPPATVAELLFRCIEQGEALLERAGLIGDFSDYESWRGARKLWIERTVDTLGRIYEGCEELDRFRGEASSSAGGQQWQAEYRHDSSCMRSAIDVLVSLQDEVAVPPPVHALAEQEADASGFGRDYSPDPDPQPAPEDDRAPEADPPPTVAEIAPAPSPDIELAPALPATTSAHTRRQHGAQVFLVHGRDEKLKQAVAELLQSAGPHEITIVNERPADRRMLLEHFEERTNGSHYAVVLLTADDVGAPRLDSAREPFYAPRARQGVVFEMGVLVAALTPRCMCVLYEDGVELPFDMDGISYVRLDLAGTWQSKLLLHMRSAGFDYDLNRLAPI